MHVYGLPYSCHIGIPEHINCGYKCKHNAFIINFFFKPLRTKSLKYACQCFWCQNVKLSPNPQSPKTFFSLFFFLSSDTTGWVRKRDVDDSWFLSLGVQRIPMIHGFSCISICCKCTAQYTPLVSSLLYHFWVKVIANQENKI